MGLEYYFFLMANNLKGSSSKILSMELALSTLRMANQSLENGPIINFYNDYYNINIMYSESQFSAEQFTICSEKCKELLEKCKTFFIQDLCSKSNTPKFRFLSFN
jgi:hypothetical protein